MHRFFIFNKQDNPRNEIIPTDDLFHQLTKVLRIRENEKFVCIYENLELECILDKGKINVINSTEFEINKNRKITLVQGIPTNKKVSLILQKTTELDVDHIILWQANRSTSKIEDFDKKEDRLSKIIVEACEQSRRNDIPQLSFTSNLDEIDFNKSNVIVLFENENETTLKQAISNSTSRDITLVIGPEGGIEEFELEQLRNKGATIATLGKNILRTETAAIAAVAMVGFEVE